MTAPREAHRYVCFSGHCRPTMEKAMLVFVYKSKKEMRENVGKPLKYIETSMFGPEYVRDGVMVGANRPHITRIGREFFAKVTLVNGLISKVE